MRSSVVRIESLGSYRSSFVGRLSEGYDDGVDFASLTEMTDSLPKLRLVSNERAWGILPFSSLGHPQFVIFVAFISE